MSLHALPVKLVRDQLIVQAETRGTVGDRALVSFLGAAFKEELRSVALLTKATFVMNGIKLRLLLGSSSSADSEDAFGASRVDGLESFVPESSVSGG